MHDEPNDLDSRVRRLDDSVERLRSEVTALNLELATLVSAVREFQHQSIRVAPPRVPRPAPASTPSFVPAAIVVLMAAGLLSWQLFTSSHVDRGGESARVAIPERSTPKTPVAPTIEQAKQSTEPPLTPLVKPTIYTGTLTVTVDHPGAEVFVNRKPVGKAPVRIRNLRAGAHLVWVERDGYRRWTRVVTVPAERVTRVAADLEPISNEH